MYAIALLTLLAAAWCTWRACRRILRPGTAGLVTILTICFLLYSSALLPGVVGQLNATSIGVVLTLLSVAAAAVFSRLFAKAPPLEVGEGVPAAAGTRVAAPAAGGSLCKGTLIAAALGLLGLAPILRFISDLPWRYVEASLMLEWDAVSYHLPALIEFLQDGSLWYLGGAYSSYSYGYELLGALPVASFNGSWPLLPVHILTLLLFLLVMYVASRALCEAVNAWLARPVPAVVVFLLAAGLFSRAFAYEMVRVGKNDLFQATCILAALCCLLETRRPPASGGSAGRMVLRASAGAALGLALATKPTTLAFLPGFVVLFAILDNPDNGVFRRRLLAASGWVGAAVLVGGFFLFRNLWSMHRLVAPDLAGGSFGQSLWATLGQREYWALHTGSVLLIIGVLSLAMGAVCVVRARRAGADSLTPIGFLVVQVSGLLALVFTPFVVQAPDNWYIRLGMAGLAPAALWVGLLGVWALSALARRCYVLEGALVAGVVAAMFLIPLRMEGYRGIGLPGHETVVAGLPPSNVYSVVQATNKPVRVYSAGLRPLGLYGPRYQNRVFYDLHSDVLSPEAKGQARLMAILQEFGPELIAISVDPHGKEPTPQKPLVDWMRRHRCFEEVYNDAAASVFLVHDGWQELLKLYPPAAGPVRMTG